MATRKAFMCSLRPNVARYNTALALDPVSPRCTGWFHTTNTTFYRKRKVKEPKPPRLVSFIQSGATQEEIENFVATREARRRATADYKAKMAEVASVFREQLKIEEDRKKDIAGEQMKKEAEEKLQGAKNLSIILESNEELRRERELRNLILKEKKQREMEQRQQEKVIEAEKLFEKRRAIVLKAIEESENFVTRENLEEKIAYALDNEVNYNFAITPDGKKLYSMKPPGNFGEHGWKGPSPAAFQLGGIKQTEWDFVFQKHYQTTGKKPNTDEVEQQDKQNES
eukprot:gene5679-6375_t